MRFKQKLSTWKIECGLADTSYDTMLLKKMHINQTVVPNQESAKNDFNDFKIDFPVQGLDFI